MDVEKFQTAKRIVQEYQTKRLQKTYHDFYDREEYTELIRFFFTEIYGTNDFGFRNQSMKSLHSSLSTFLRSDIITAVGKVIELHELTEKLDNKMAVLLLKNSDDLEINYENYQSIYKKMDNYEERKFQIRLTLEATHGIHKLSQIWLIGISLKAVKGAAELAGYGKIMHFLNDGYNAFNSLKSITDFLDAIEIRETTLNNELFGIEN